MKIKPLETFLDGRDKFVKGEVRDVDDERGKGFIKAGWAEDDAGKVKTGERATGSAKLAVEDSKINVEKKK